MCSLDIGAEGFGTLGGETETCVLSCRGPSEWHIGMDRGDSGPQASGTRRSSRCFLRPASGSPQVGRGWAHGGLSGTWPLRETESPGGLSLVVRCPSQKQLAASSSPLAPPGRVREGGGTPATGCREGEQAPAALASAGSSGTGPCEGRGAACQGPPSGQQGPRGLRRPPARGRTVSVEGEAANRGPASSLEQKTRLQNQLPLPDGLGLGVEDDLSVGDLGSGILKGPKDQFPEEGNKLFCGVKQWRGS